MKVTSPLFFLYFSSHSTHFKCLLCYHVTRHVIPPSLSATYATIVTHLQDCQSHCRPWQAPLWYHLDGDWRSSYNALLSSCHLAESWHHALLAHSVHSMCLTHISHYLISHDHARWHLPPFLDSGVTFHSALSMLQHSFATLPYSFATILLLRRYLYL